MLANGQETKQIYIWIDAISINQNDKKERGEQVLRMPEIYRAAKTTFVWLGEGTSMSDKAMDFMNQNEKRAYEMDPDLLQARNYRQEYLALTEEIFIREWWQRIWIVQEVTVSHDLLVLCGHKTVSWKLLIQFMGITHEYHKPAVAEILRSVKAKGMVENADLGIRLNANRDSWHESGRQPFPLQLTFFRTWRATDPRDKVYGILGMTIEAKNPTLRPNYDFTPQRVFKTATRFIIEYYRTLNFILIATGPRQLESLPSWTPDFTVPGTHVPVPLKGFDRFLDHFLYSAAKDTPMTTSFLDDNNVMCAKGIEADSVEELAPYWDPGLSTDDYEAQLMNGTYLAWSNLTRPMASNIKLRYGPEASLIVAMGKMLTADRQVDDHWERTRFGAKESFIDLQVEPPEAHQTIGTQEQQRSQWQQARKQMVEGTLTWRRFMITKTGYIGIVPETTEPNDVICVLFGCDTPVVLRPKAKYFVLVGECYVYGIMDGELVDALHNGAVSEKYFEIR